MKNENILRQETRIHKIDRENLLKQKGCVLWFTGLSGSGKSTIASKIEYNLYKMGKLTYLMDGDNIRLGLNIDLDFSPESRDENIRRIGEVSLLFADSGIITLVSFISPYRAMRNIVREKIGKSFIEIFVKADIDICKKRDPKGLYLKASKGEIDEFTGISAPYEEPVKPEIVLDTEKMSIDEEVIEVIDYLKKGNFI